MNKLSAIGALSLITGLLMLVFKAISSQTEVKLAFPDLTIENVVSPDKLEWIDSMAAGIIHNFASGFVSTPLYLFCIVIGIIMLVVSGFIKK